MIQYGVWMLHLERILSESSWRWRRKERDCNCKGMWQTTQSRKTSTGRLLDADVPANYVAQLSGHKNLKSLNSYKSASLPHQRKISLVLSRSEHMEHTTSTTTSNKLEISTASASTTKPNASVYASVHLQVLATFQHSCMVEAVTTMHARCLRMFH